MVSYGVFIAVQCGLFVVVVSWITVQYELFLVALMCRSYFRWCYWLLCNMSFFICHLILSVLVMSVAAVLYKRMSMGLG